MNVVVDASVAIKWFFRLRADEANVDAALRLLEGVLDEHVSLVQPPHFIAEVSAVLARESPKTAKVALGELLDIDMQFVESSAVYSKAVDLALHTGHHLFDTLYHAVALDGAGGVLVTADDSYFRKARKEGRIVRLADFQL